VPYNDPAICCSMINCRFLTGPPPLLVPLKHSRTTKRCVVINPPPPFNRRFLKQKVASFFATPRQYIIQFLKCVKETHIHQSYVGSNNSCGQVQIFEKNRAPAANKHKLRVCCVKFSQQQNDQNIVQIRGWGKGICSCKMRFSAQK